MKLHSRQINSPVGKLIITIDGNSLVSVDWPRTNKILPATNLRDHPVLTETEKQLREFFAGKRKSFNLPINFSQGTPFQQKVWRALQSISHGQTQSYSQIAEAIGQPKAGRAVGNAIRKNPIAIIVPCHRVIGKNKKLTGFAGGLDNKMKLLNLESADFRI